jgi:hypothetical protein
MADCEVRTGAEASILVHLCAALSYFVAYLFFDALAVGGTLLIV